MKENIGKLILVSDYDCKENAYIKKFEGYYHDDVYPFRTLNTGWEYAWLIDPDELAKGDSNV